MGLIKEGLESGVYVANDEQGEVLDALVEAADRAMAAPPAPAKKKR